jgi:hypothetical protein
VSPGHRHRARGSSRTQRILAGHAPQQSFQRWRVTQRHHPAPFGNSVDGSPVFGTHSPPKHGTHIVRVPRFPLRRRSPGPNPFVSYSRSARRHRGSFPGCTLYYLGSRRNPDGTGHSRPSGRGPRAGPRVFTTGVDGSRLSRGGIPASAAPPHHPRSGLAPTDPWRGVDPPSSSGPRSHRLPGSPGRSPGSDGPERGCGPAWPGCTHGSDRPGQPPVLPAPSVAGQGGCPTRPCGRVPRVEATPATVGVLSHNQRRSRWGTVPGSSSPAPVTPPRSYPCSRSSATRGPGPRDRCHDRSGQSTRVPLSPFPLGVAGTRPTFSRTRDPFRGRARTPELPCRSTSGVRPRRFTVLWWCPHAVMPAPAARDDSMRDDPIPPEPCWFGSAGIAPGRWLRLPARSPLARNVSPS